MILTCSKNFTLFSISVKYNIKQHQTETEYAEKTSNIEKNMNVKPRTFLLPSSITSLALCNTLNSRKSKYFTIETQLYELNFFDGYFILKELNIKYLQGLSVMNGETV